MDNKEVFKKLFETTPDRVDREKLESPLEELFIEYLEKYISVNVKIYPQYTVQTSWGNFRLDFVIEFNGVKIGFECDGKDFHDEWRDEFRDGLILGKSEIEEIFRFRGKDLHTFLEDCIFIIYSFHENIFTDRYKQIFTGLTSETIRTKNFKNSERISIDYYFRNDRNEIVQMMNLLVEKRDVKNPGHWQKLYNFSLKYPGTKLDDLLKLRETASH